MDIEQYISQPTNCRLWSQISLEWIDISKIRKVLDQLHFIPYPVKKIWWMWLIARVIKDTNFTRGAPFKIWEGKKRPKFSAILDNCRLWSQISLEWIDISKIRKVLDQVHFIPYPVKKIWWSLVH